MRTTRRIIAVAVVTLLLVGLAMAALAGPRFERGLPERDRDRVVEQVETDDVDEVMLREREHERLRARDVEDVEVHHDRARERVHHPQDTETRQHHDHDRERIHHPEDTEARQHHDRDRQRLHDECEQKEQRCAAPRHERGSEREPVRPRERHGR